MDIFTSSRERLTSVVRLLSWLYIKENVNCQNVFKTTWSAIHNRRIITIITAAIFITPMYTVVGWWAYVGVLSIWGCFEASPLCTIGVWVYLECVWTDLAERECRSSICKWQRMRARSRSSCPPRTTARCCWARWRPNFRALRASNIAIPRINPWGAWDWMMAGCIRPPTGVGAPTFITVCFQKVSMLLLNVCAPLLWENVYFMANIMECNGKNE